MKKRIVGLMLLVIVCVGTIHADDWVLFESKYWATHYTDHLYLEVFLADLDGKNTYCQEGTLIATNGSKSIDLVRLKYINEGDDEDQTAKVKATLLMKNAKAWFTNSQSGDQELSTSEKTHWLTKWGSDYHYMTTKINLYYSSEMAGGTWKIYFHFKHSNDNWYDKVLGYSVTTSSNLGLPDYDVNGYKVERTGLDKITFTVPKLPNDIDSKFSSIRMRKATYDVRYMFFKQDGTSVTMDQQYEASTTQEKKEECSFPEGVGNPTRIHYQLTAVHGVKDPDNWFNRQEKRVNYLEAFPVVSVPGAVTTDYHQFDKQAVLAWSTPAGSNYMKVTPYIYRIETDAAGTPKSGTSWSKRGSVSSTNGGSLHFTDDNVSTGTYYRYMAVNVPTEWINHGINESSLNNPTDDLLAQLGCSYSEVMNTAPTMSIYRLQQDTAVTDKVRLTWQYSRVPSDNATVSFKVLRKTSRNGDWSEYGTVSGDANPEAGTTLAFEDTDLPNSTARYQYKIRLEEKGYRFESDAVSGGLLSGTTLKSFTATKGTHDGSVTLSWNAKQVGTAHSNYVISRRYVNTNGEFMQIYTTNGADANYSYEDNTVKPGYYYEYKVEIYEGDVLQNTLYTVGFCQAKGTISGIVKYGSGTSVPGVKFWLRPSAADEDNTVKTSSQYVHGASAGIAWEADATETGKLFGDGKAFTLQCFVRPDEDLASGAVLGHIPGTGTLFLGSSNEEGYDLCLFGASSMSSTGVRLPAGKFSLLTLSRSGDQLSVQADKGEQKTMTAESLDINAPFSIGGAQGVTAAQAFKGNLVELRVWDHVLSETERSSYADRMLHGRESGLVLYWPLDEGLERYAFDASYANDLPNGRHATVGNNITPSVIVPSDEQLARYGVANDNGEYLIRGIPFMGSGSSYTLVPEKGIHRFNPDIRSLFISPTSLTANNVDFEDVSSFPMTGHIYYAGTNIPAEGIMFYVDGTLLSSDGKAQQTDADGYYNISVPIGEHYVEAKLEGHTLVDGGRFPTTGTYNFADRVRHDFADSTLVNFVGRVSGAKYNDTLKVGFAQSHNNIGIATVTLKLNNESFSFNCADDYISPATENRSFASDTASIQSKTWTGVGAASKYIYITTDSLTGEFSALLPPLKYTVQSVEVKKNSEVEFSSLSDIDLTNPAQKRTDSIRIATESGDTITRSYTYHTKKIWTHIAGPQVDVVEANHPKGAFGRDSLLIPLEDMQNDTLRHIYTVDGSGNVQYLFNYPVYQMLDGVEYAVHGYEAYTNYDSGTPVTDTVALNGLEMTIGNEMSDDQFVVYDAPEGTQYKPGDIYEMKYNTITLDKEGRARIQWSVGVPNIVSPFTRQLNMTLKRDDRTYEAFRMDAIVLGQLTNGNNFVTQGPSDVLFILRDPYGAHSKTTLKKGTVNTKTEYYTYQRSGEHALVADWIGGTDVTTATGIGFAFISKSSVTTEITTGVKASWKYTHKEDKIYKQTTVESYSTGDKYPYVGANGDVFVGTSNNILVGTCRKVHAKKDVQTNQYNIVLEDALALGAQVATSFAYSQYELENVMIPKWKDQRKQYLTQVATETEARNYVNNTDHAKCVTWLSPSDPKYGEKDTYVYVEPQVQPETTEIDSVLWCNNQIAEWEKYLKKNEEEKIKAIKEGKFTNYSIDGGTTRTFTYRNDTTKIDQTQTDYSIQAVLGWQQGWGIKAIAAVGVQTNLTTNVGGGDISGSGDDEENYTEWEYVLNDGNRDADLSINVYDAESGNNSKIFSLFGGQTYNPHEPADSTHYYMGDDGKPLPLGNGTVRMEQPYMLVGAGNSAPAKSVTLTDIPAGQSATATLYCSNMTNTHQVLPFGYDVSVIEKTNTTGLQILMDGVPINGRTIWMEQGTTSQKVITVQQTDQSILDHEGVCIRFLSQYQPAIIYDEVVINAHFKPSSSPVELAVANPVVNTDPTTGNGNLNLTVSGFNRQFKNLKNIGIQYRFAGNTQWTNLHTWVTNAEDITDATYELLPDKGDLKLTLDMSGNLSYPEGEYEFRAYTMTPYGAEQVQVYSEVTKVVKDMTLPRPLYTPAPANGILGIGDQLAVEFNEDIVPGYVGDKNAIITAKLNGRPIDHEVSLRLLPYGDQVRTMNPVFLSGNFSMEFWLNWHEAGTVLHQGAGEGNFSIAIDAEGYVIVNVAGIAFTSKVTVPADKWMFIAMNYKAETMTFNMLAQYDETTAMLFQNTVVPESEVRIVDNVEDNYLYLGRIYANIHDLALYNTYRDVLEAAGKKYESKDAYTYGLTNYWPMNEGHGKIAEDSRHTHDFSVTDTWDIANINYSLRLDAMTGAQVDISRINTTLNDSYVIELWYEHYSLDNDTIWETDGMRLRYEDKRIVLEYGTKSHTVVSYDDFPEMTSGWHHLALNVVRGQAASFYFDGHRTAVIAEADMPVLKGAAMTLAKGGQLSYVDELRIWKATLSEERLLANRYHTMDTSEVYSRGLMAYFPFEKDSVINGVDTKGETLENMAPKSEAGDMEAPNYAFVESTPPLKNAPREVRLTAAPVASERKVVINLLGTEVTPRELEGTTLNITLAEIHDLHGNTSNPIKWTAYVQQNTLKWKKDSVNIYKKYGESYTFDVDIENKGGQIEYYTVANMPEWLTLVEGEQSDDLKPLKTKTLRFAVNALVPVNDYDVTIGLQGNNEILEPLRIVMKVRGETPDWAVDPTLYDHNMTIIGQVFIGGILMENSESLVAAFIGGECRGIASPTKVRGTAYVSLAIYGHDVADADANKPVSFRIWDATRGVAYTDARIALEGIDTLIIFHQDTLIGNYDVPAIWTKSDKVEQLLSVHENWNWIALGVAPETQYCDLLFADYSGWGILLKDRNTYIQSNGSEWKGNLVPAHNTMYKIKITRTPATQSATLQTQFSVRGQQPALKDMPVVLEPGWNWIAYTPLTTKRINAALAGAKPKAGDIIKSQTAVSIYGTSGWEGTLTSLESGHGYLYYSTEDKVKSFTYPEDLYTPAYGAPSLVHSFTRSLVHSFTPVDQHNYPSNMTMTIRLMDGKTSVDTCEIAAFIDNECRGAIRADEEGLYYLVISGEGAGQAMSIRTVLNGEEVTIDSNLTYVSDDHVGTPWEPYVIQLNPAEGIQTVGAEGAGTVRAYKVLEDDHIIIIRNGERYDMTGKKR